jgi:tagatose 6-phosphate kinase
MILVVCPNLAIDVTLEVDAFSVGEVHRARRTTRHAGGKGVNFARAANALGERAVVLGLVAGERGEEIARRLKHEGIDAELVSVRGESRTCTIVLEPSGRASVVNEAGPPVDAASELVGRFQELLRSARAVALAGSLQPGLAPELYRELASGAIGAGKLCLVDASGEALSEALAGHPSVVKPNRAEAETLLGRTLDTDEACARAVTDLRHAGAETAMVTRGADGLVAGTADGVVRCRSRQPVDIALGNPTGAGDALAAGVVVGYLRGLPPVEAVRLGVAAATASLAEGYGRFRAKDVRIEAVDVEARAPE